MERDKLLKPLEEAIYYSYGDVTRCLYAGHDMGELLDKNILKGLNSTSLKDNDLIELFGSADKFKSGLRNSIGFMSEFEDIWDKNTSRLNYPIVEIAAPPPLTKVEFINSTPSSGNIIK